MRRMLIAVLLLPIMAFAGDLEFAGGLEHVTPESILIRLADGRRRIDAKLPKTGALAAEAISAHYKLTDELHITRKPVGQEKCLDLKSLKFLRPPTPKERAVVLGSPKPAADSPDLAYARQVNLDRATNMPKFVADETAKRYTSPRKANAPVWKPVDTIDSEIMFKGNKPTREHVRLNGKPWNKPGFPNFTCSWFRASFGRSRTAELVRRSMLADKYSDHGYLVTGA